MLPLQHTYNLYTLPPYFICILSLYLDQTNACSSFLILLQMFGPNKKVELCILSFLVILWLVTIWFNTTIKGIAGEGKEQYNLYFSSWLCLWITFWTLERWFVSSGKSSFQQFVSSWPHRCPLWIVSFILSFSNFLFVLDAVSTWLLLMFGPLPTFLAHHNV